MSLASPQDYCDLFAKDAANRKTGQSGVITGTIDNSSSGSEANSARPRVLPEIENWQRAYEQSVTACLENYGASIAVAPVKATNAARGAKVTQHERTRRFAEQDAGRQWSGDGLTSGTFRHLRYSSQLSRLPERGGRMTSSSEEDQA